jgi:hypothetical protein
VTAIRHWLYQELRFKFDMTATLLLNAHGTRLRCTRDYRFSAVGGVGGTELVEAIASDAVVLPGVLECLS